MYVMDLQQFSIQPAPHCQGGGTPPLRLYCGLPDEDAVRCRRNCWCSYMQHLILYSKPGCHLCEGLQEKLEQIVETGNFVSLQLEVRDIMTREDWFQAYQYEVPVLFLVNREDAKDAEEKEEAIPRPSPRATVQQLEQMLRKYL